MSIKVKVISLPYIFQVLYVLCFSRPKYQVSVYRTIGPLVANVKTKTQDSCVEADQCLCFPYIDNAIPLQVSNC